MISDGHGIGAVGNLIGLRCEMVKAKQIGVCAAVIDQRRIGGQIKVSEPAGLPVKSKEICDIVRAEYWQPFGVGNKRVKITIGGIGVHAEGRAVERAILDRNGPGRAAGMSGSQRIIMHGAIFQ